MTITTFFTSEVPAATARTCAPLTSFTQHPSVPMSINATRLDVVADRGRNGYVGSKQGAPPREVSR